MRHGTAALSADLLRRAFPRPVGIGLLAGEPPAPWPEEAALLGPRAVEKRRRQFALGRAAARLALADAGLPLAPVGKGANGEPLWPEGVVGAISHTGEVGLAVVARAADYRGVGVDLEAGGADLDARAERLFCLPEEQAWVDADNRAHAAERRIALFSAKEAVFKALYPLEHVYLGYRDALLTPHPDGFEARLLKAAGGDFLAGFTLRVWCWRLDDLVVSATWI